MGRGSGVPVGERQRVDSGGRSEETVNPVAPPRHCWVGDGRAARWPGVLLEWRSTPLGWEGRVAYGVASGDSVRLVEQWVTAKHLTPNSSS
jgi:hypothetical protein